MCWNLLLRMCASRRARWRWFECICQSSVLSSQSVGLIVVSETLPNRLVWQSAVLQWLKPSIFLVPGWHGQKPCPSQN
jgi:hypothetical protein